MDRMQELKNEMSAMKRITNILKRLPDEAARRRVIVYVSSRFEQESLGGRQLELADDKETKAG